MSAFVGVNEYTDSCGRAKEKIIIPPEGGWLESRYYVVEKSCGENNLVHTDIFFTGFLNGGKEDEKIPGGYNGFFNDSEYRYNNIYYMRALHLIEGIKR